MYITGFRNNYFHFIRIRGTISVSSTNIAPEATRPRHRNRYDCRDPGKDGSKGPPSGSRGVYFEEKIKPLMDNPWVEFVGENLGSRQE